MRAGAAQEAVGAVGRHWRLAHALSRWACSRQGRTCVDVINVLDVRSLSLDLYEDRLMWHLVESVSPSWWDKLTPSAREGKLLADLVVQYLVVSKSGVV